MHMIDSVENYHVFQLETGGGVNEHIVIEEKYDGEVARLGRRLRC